MATFMNTYDIENALRLLDTEETPNLGIAVRVIDLLADWTDRNSDGWAYWQKPQKAAAKLIDLIQSADRFDPQDVSAAEVKKAITPIRSFLTRQGQDAETILFPPTPACPHATVVRVGHDFACHDCGAHLRPVAYESVV